MASAQCEWYVIQNGRSTPDRGPAGPDPTGHSRQVGTSRGARRERTSDRTACHATRSTPRDSATVAPTVTSVFSFVGAGPSPLAPPFSAAARAAAEHEGHVATSDATTHISHATTLGEQRWQAQAHNPGAYYPDSARTYAQKAKDTQPLWIQHRRATPCLRPRAQEPSSRDQGAASTGGAETVPHQCQCGPSTTTGASVSEPLIHCTRGGVVRCFLR